MSEQRDLRADLEICNKAYCGPWTHNEYWRVENPETIASGGSICRAFCENNAEFISSARAGWPEAIERAIKAEEELEKQQQLFEAQTGRNVEIIKRLNERKKEVCEENTALREENDQQRDSIQQLSAQVVQLREALDLIRIHFAENICHSLTCRWEYCQGDKCESYEIRTLIAKTLNTPNPGADLLAKMEKLEAVVEAAKPIGICPNCDNNCRYCPIIDLQQALAALEGDSEGK